MHILGVLSGDAHQRRSRPASAYRDLAGAVAVTADPYTNSSRSTQPQTASRNRVPTPIHRDGNSRTLIVELRRHLFLARSHVSRTRTLDIFPVRHHDRRHQL